MLLLRTAAVAALAMSSASASAAPVYLWQGNMTVSLGSSMPAEPFANRTTAESLENAINLPSADATELHTQDSHVWVSGGVLELYFDFGQEYDLTTLHFWNYHSEGFDVDDIDLTFFNAEGAQVGSLLDIEPRLGNSTGSDSTPITAEDLALSLLNPVQLVYAIFSGTNDQVDWNNIGFTGDLSGTSPPSPVPLPAGALLFLTGIAIMGAARLVRG